MCVEEEQGEDWLGTHSQVCWRYRIIKVKRTPPRIAVNMLCVERGREGGETLMVCN